MELVAERVLGTQVLLGERCEGIEGGHAVAHVLQEVSARSAQVTPCECVGALTQERPATATESAYGDSSSHTPLQVQLAQQHVSC